MSYYLIRCSATRSSDHQFLYVRVIRDEKRSGYEWDEEE